jgi:hypothetical protein
VTLTVSPVALRITIDTSLPDRATTTTAHRHPSHRCHFFRTMCVQQTAPTPWSCLPTA